MSKDQKQICLYCRYWALETDLDDDQDSWVGGCRRYVPRREAGSSIATWPRTFSNYWCGEFGDRPDDHGSDKTWEPIGDVASGILSRMKIEGQS